MLFRCVEREDLEHFPDVKGRPLPPETDGEAPAGSQYAVGLVDSLAAASPDAVDRHDGVEALIAPRQLEHRPNPQVRSRRTLARHGHELGGCIDARDVSTH